MRSFQPMRCRCPAGWHGTTCAEDTDDCLQQPCENGAECSESQHDATIPPASFKCACSAGYVNGFCDNSTIAAYASDDSQCAVLNAACDI
eukprot:SAG11_NODE_35143_length_268_cov_0.609467_1_plen_89_part_11